MKALFTLGSSQLIINDFEQGDLDFILRLSSVKNRWRKDHEPLQQEGFVKDLCFYENDDPAIVGLNENANPETITEKIAALQKDADQKWKYYTDENAKCKALEERIRCLESQLKPQNVEGEVA